MTTQSLQFSHASELKSGSVHKLPHFLTCYSKQLLILCAAPLSERRSRPMPA